MTTKAFFNWGKKDEYAEYDKQEAFEAQQAILRKRRTGDTIKEADERRSNVANVLREKRELRQAEKDALGQGIVPESLKKWKNYDKKEDEGNLFNAGVVVPLLPFGINKYDEGERFDLRSPYADEGWVDPADAEDPWAGLKRLFGGRKEEDAAAAAKPKDKRVIWASQYTKYKAEQEEIAKAAKAAAIKEKKEKKK